MSSFIIKIIAIISMLFDHTNDVFIGHLSVFNLIGRIAFPLFSFQLVVGYTYTHNIKKYILRMFIFSLISQIPYSTFIYIYTGTYFELNIFFTLATSLICMYVLSSKNINVYLKLLYISICLIIAYYLKFDYSIFGILYPLFVFVFYPFQEKFGKNRFSLSSFLCMDNDSHLMNNNYRQNIKNPVTTKNNLNNNFNHNSNHNSSYNFSNNSIIKLIFFIAGTLALSIVKYVKLIPLISTSWFIGLVLFTFIPAIIMIFFNGKKGPSLKYIFYIFYPAHLLLLELIYLLTH